MKFSDLYNPIMRFVLRSPLHGIISSSILILSFTGRKSGRTYDVPLEYARDGNTLVAITQMSRVWWKNLRGGVPVTVLLQGKTLSGTATAIAGDASAFNAAFMIYLNGFPGRGEKYFNVHMEDDGNLNQTDVARAAENHVAVRIELT